MFPTDWSSRSAVTIATCRRYGPRYLRSRRISTEACLLAEGRSRFHLGPADPVGSTAERDLLEEQGDDHRERGDACCDEEDVVKPRSERASDREQDRRGHLPRRRGIEDGLRVARLRRHRSREL